MYHMLHALEMLQLTICPTCLGCEARSADEADAESLHPRCCTDTLHCTKRLRCEKKIDSARPQSALWMRRSRATLYAYICGRHLYDVQ